MASGPPNEPPSTDCSPGVGSHRISHAEGVRAGEWRREHAAIGITLAHADCLIAAAAVALGVPLATDNPTAFAMAEVQVQHWAVGI